MFGTNSEELFTYDMVGGQIYVLCVRLCAFKIARGRDSFQVPVHHLDVQLLEINTIPLCKQMIQYGIGMCVSK